MSPENKQAFDLTITGKVQQTSSAPHTAFVVTIAETPVFPVVTRNFSSLPSGPYFHCLNAVHPGSTFISEQGLFPFRTRPLCISVLCETYVKISVGLQCMAPNTDKMPCFLFVVFLFDCCWVEGSVPDPQLTSLS